jgi:membrane protein implicated in regulation of membrane protease activity
MSGAVFLLILAIVAVVIIVAGLTPFLFIPLAVLALFILLVPSIGGAARRFGRPDPEEPRAHRPGTAEASHDPASGPQH